MIVLLSSHVITLNFICAALIGFSQVAVRTLRSIAPLVCDGQCLPAVVINYFLINDFVTAFCWLSCGIPPVD